LFDLTLVANVSNNVRHMNGSNVNVNKLVLASRLRYANGNTTQHSQIINGHGMDGIFEQLANDIVDMLLVRQDNIGRKPSVTGIRCKISSMYEALEPPTCSTTTT
jgi:hypothetical protein